MADLGAIFDQHVASEFVTKDLDATMETMVDEPHVWHVPALTGGSGGDAIRTFYASEFIGHTPDDAVLTPIARTVSNDRVVDVRCSRSATPSRLTVSWRLLQPALEGLQQSRLFCPWQSDV